MNSTCLKRNVTLRPSKPLHTKGGLNFNSRVIKTRFKEGDLVLRKVLPNTKEVNAEVLGINWENPYIIAKVLRPRTYKIKHLDGKLVPWSWNAEHLRPYYK